MKENTENPTKPRSFQPVTRFAHAVWKYGRCVSARGANNLILCQKFLRYYLTVAAIVLILTALFKVAGSFSTKPYLNTTDPLLFFIGQRWVLLLAALAELACAAVVIFRGAYAGLLVTSWLLVLFGIYRVGINTLGAGGNVCPCLGYWLPMSPEATRNLSLGLYCFMVLGNTCGLVLCWKDWKSVSAVKLSQNQK